MSVQKDVFDVVVNQNSQLLGGHLAVVDGAYEYQGLIKKLEVIPKTREIRFLVPGCLYRNRDSGEEGRSNYGFTVHIADHTSVQAGQQAFSFRSKEGKKAAVCRKDVVQNVDPVVLQEIGKRHLQSLS